MALDAILDEFEAFQLQRQAREKEADMKRHGTRTEPTQFTYPQLVGFYEVALQKIKDCISYSKRNPAHTKTIKEKINVAREHIKELVDFHAAWYVLRASEPSLTPEAFKKMDPEERHGRFVAVLEENARAYPGLYEARAQVIKLCVGQGILPQEYR